MSMEYPLYETRVCVQPEISLYKTCVKKSGQIQPHSKQLWLG